MMVFVCSQVVLYYFCSDEAAEGAAGNDDGGRTLCGRDRQEACDGFSDGDLQRHQPHVQDPTPDGYREEHQGHKE